MEEGCLRSRRVLPGPDDPAIIERFSNAIRIGHPISTAAELAGIGDTTARRYIERGAAEAEGEEQGSYRGFWEAFKQAEAAFVDENLQRIQVAAQEPKHWTAAMTLLERRRPQDFGRNQKVTVESTSVSVSVALPALTEQHVLALIRDSLDSGVKLLPPPPE